MPDSWPKSTFRGVFRWYLSKFPLRDGKAYFYERLHGALAPPERYAVVRLDKGFRMKLDLADPEQLKVYFYGHYHERYEAALVQRLLADDDVFWDIGANVGYFALVAATALDRRGQIVAFEPGENAYARLVENLALNSYHNVKTFNVAVSDREGEAVLHVSGDIADSSASLYEPGQTQAQGQACRTVALDHFLAAGGLRPPNLIKLDVEGAELAVLQGARELLAHTPPLFLMEMEEKTLTAAGTSKAAIQQFLTGYGYRAAHLSKGRWYATADVQGVKGRNIFWFNSGVENHRRRAALLPVHGENP
ncbi:MAG: FkbM family methyltransferase [Syntrophobacterales bacterium]|jgi:FkbM family methyltransferase|nr:FkbM family methyltransferase [Syntrophobacterales bacterium]